MKHLFEQYAAYDVWANGKLLSFIENLDEEISNRDIPSSFPSLYKTILHLWDAESIWFQRMQLSGNIVRPSENKTLSIKGACDGLLNQSHQWENFVQKELQTDDDFNKILGYKNLKGEYFEEPLWQILLHLFNHSTYHRGQLITMLHGLGITGVPNTDYIAFARLRVDKI